LCWTEPSPLSRAVTIELSSSLLFVSSLVVIVLIILAGKTSYKQRPTYKRPSDLTTKGPYNWATYRPNNQPTKKLPPDYQTTKPNDPKDWTTNIQWPTTK
jgi:hypothetical protein